MTKPLRTEFERSAETPSDFPTTGLPEVALVGRSNVGKSRLLNRLAGIRQLARVSRKPGRTQLINFYRVGGEFYLADLPGYGFARVPLRIRKKWEKLVTDYLFQRIELRLIVLIIDGRRKPMDNDLEVSRLLARSGVPYIVVGTKWDKLTRALATRQQTELARVFCSFGEVPFITFSAITGEGRKELWNAIENHVREARQRPRKTK